MAQVFTPGKTTQVKNLGWLLKNSQYVTMLGMNVYDCERGGELVGMGMKDGVPFTYITPIASVSIMLRWCNRPVFMGTKFVMAKNLNEKEYCIIGDDTWKAYLK